MNTDETSLDPALLAALRTGRQPVTGHDDAEGALRVFAIQYRIDLAHAESIDSYRAAMRALMDELVVPHLVPGRPTLVVYPEAVGLPGARHRRARSGHPRARVAARAGAGRRTAMPVTLLAGMQALAEASMDRIGAYAGLFGPDAIDPRTAVHLAGTDTAARAFSQTFSDIALDYGVWVVAGNYQTPYRETIDPGRGRRVRRRRRRGRVRRDHSGGHERHVPVGPGRSRCRRARRRAQPALPQREGAAHRHGARACSGLAEGPVEGEDARANAGWADVAGFRIGFATSLPAFAYGYPFGERPDGLRPARRCAHVVSPRRRTPSASTS